ncbi:hypothetical protein EYF80_061388 [Liparis tanakae]|uniref:Uncharacterized protein n=1 Tax=Liparis tanakae TaxID=230148 RepID=A0A4Z2EJ51_9TELE|nr:hypothetical protein EYF80_061388 [Liparis tanakae]
MSPTCTRPHSSAAPPRMRSDTMTGGLDALCFTRKPRPPTLRLKRRTEMMLGCSWHTVGSDSCMAPFMMSDMLLCHNSSEVTELSLNRAQSVRAYTRAGAWPHSQSGALQHRGHPTERTDNDVTIDGNYEYEYVSDLDVTILYYAARVKRMFRAGTEESRGIVLH